MRRAKTNFIPSILPSPRDLEQGMKDKSASWSFRTRFLLSSIIATLVIPTVAAIFFFQGELMYSKDLILKDSVNLSENIAKHLYPTLAFEDQEAAKDQLEGLQNNPQINHSSIWKGRGHSEDGYELFCSTRKTEADAQQQLLSYKDGETWTDSDLIIVRSIHSSDDEQPIGKIVIERSLAHLNYKKSQFKRLGFTSLGFYDHRDPFRYHLVSKHPYSPPSGTHKRSGKISNERDYGLRAKKISTDEFGKLTDLFNEMLDSINDTNDKLLVANLEMEQRVQDRTKQLMMTNEKLLSEIKERERANKELIETRDKLSKQEKLASVGQVSSNIAHELRNPMAAIRNSTYFLRIKNKKDEKSTHHLEIIDRELSRSDEVIQRLLQLTKGGSLKREMTDLRDLAREAMTYANVTGMQIFPSIPSQILPCQSRPYFVQASSVQSFHQRHPSHAQRWRNTLGRLQTGRRKNPALCFRSRGGNRRDDDEKDIRTLFYQQERRRRLRLVLFAVN